MENTMLKQKGLSQEGLKLIACITMLIDHCDATLLHSYIRVASNSQMAALIYNLLRIPGLIAFPIFSFLLVEGAHHTRDAKKYAARLAIAAVLSEIPFRLAFAGITMGDCSVMVILLLGFLMIQSMGRVKSFWKVIVVIPFYLISDWIPMDHGGDGILLIAMLELTYGLKHEKLWRLAGFFLLFYDSTRWNIGYDIMVPMNLLHLLSIIPIFCYNGRKLTYSKKVQWAFYLFYPVHIFLLWLLNLMIFG